MRVTYQILTTEDLYSDAMRTPADYFILDIYTMEAFEAEVRLLTGSSKPLVVITGLFSLHDADIATMMYSNFLIHEGLDKLIVSHVTNEDDGFHRAIEAILRELNEETD